jgi:nucleoside-diphosphate-sugar epimerase
LEHAVVIGAGPVGLAIAAQLVEEGYEPTMVTRSGSAAGGTKSTMADITVPAAALAAVRGASVVFQCAQPAYHRWTEEFPQLQAAVLDACAAVGAPLIATENSYGYGFVEGPITDGMPMNPNTRKGRVRAEMWDSLADAHRSGRAQTAAVRASDFFGPGVEGSAFGDRFFDAIVAGKKAELLGDPDAAHSITYVPDLARAMIAVAADPASWGGAWHAPTAPAITQREIVEVAAAAAGTEPIVRVVKPWQLWALGIVVKPVREMIEMRYEFEHDYVVDSTAFEQRFGITPTPLTESLAETVRWFSTRHRNGG